MTRLVPLILLCALCAPATVTKRKTVRRRPAPPKFDEAMVNNPALATRVGPKSSGAAVLRAQILLDRANFSSGEIDGSYGHNLGLAIKAYQQAHGMEPSGAITAEMWNLLNADQAPALITYTIAPEDVAGPFEPIPADMMEKAKLKIVNYESPREGLAEKFHISPALLTKLNPGKQFDQAGTEIQVPNVMTTPPAAKAASVVVSGTDRTVQALDAEGKVIAFYPATVGSEHDPLPVGEWKVTIIKKNPIFFYNSDLFWDANEQHAKAKIAPGPRNPVGVVWIGLSKEHYGIHGTPVPQAIGHTQSHGCIRLTNWDAAELAQLVAKGTPAILKE